MTSEENDVLSNNPSLLVSNRFVIFIPDPLHPPIQSCRSPNVNGRSLSINYTPSQYVAYWNVLSCYNFFAIERYLTGRSTHLTNNSLPWSDDSKNTGCCIIELLHDMFLLQQSASHTPLLAHATYCLQTPIWEGRGSSDGAYLGSYSMHQLLL